MKKTIIAVFIMFIGISCYAYNTNWYADEHFSLGIQYYQNAQYNKAIKEFHVAIKAYETSVLTARAPQRGKMYYYLALANFQILENFAINNPNYKILNLKARAFLQKAIDIQFENPVVDEYYKTDPNLIFKSDELSFVPEVREYQELIHLQKLYNKRDKSNMFTFSRNINMKHNILEMGASAYKEPAAPPEEAKEQPTKPSATPTDEGTKNKQPYLPEESREKAKQVEQRTEDILPTNY
ncbi:hypothetical protein KKB18_10120 [bacterium]|nr:hypothetical protein [bacterium]